MDKDASSSTTTSHVQRELAERKKEVESLQRRLVTLHAQHEISLQEKENELQVGKEKQKRLMALLSELEGKVQGPPLLTGGGDGEASPWSSPTGDTAKGGWCPAKRSPDTNVSLYLNNLSRTGVEKQSEKKTTKGEPHGDDGDDDDDDEEEEEGDASLLARVHRLEVEKELLSSHLFQAEKQNRLLEDKLQKSTAALLQKTTATGEGGGGGRGATTSKRDERDPKSSSSPSVEDEPSRLAVAPPLPSGRRSLPETDSSVEEPHADHSHPPERSAIFSRYVSVLQDEITNLRYRLQRKKVEARKLELIQVKAMLDTPSTPVSRINADVKQLFRLMKEKMVSEGIHHEAERVRMNEVMYALEKEMSSSGY